MLKIAIDMDGTIADFTTRFKDKITELYGIETGSGYIDARAVYDNLPDDWRSKYSNHYEIYEDLCDKGFFLNLDPYPGAINAVNRLFKVGYDIYFLTKTLNWDRSAPEKAQWLKKYFPDKKYKIIMVDSTKSKHLIDVDVIIDDDPRVLEGDMDATKICIAQPWNADIRYYKSNSCNFIVAKDMVDASRIILDVIKPSTDEWNTIWCNK